LEKEVEVIDRILAMQGDAESEMRSGYSYSMERRFTQFYLIEATFIENWKKVGRINFSLVFEKQKKKAGCRGCYRFFK
jgi:hypothetical protein